MKSVFLFSLLSILGINSFAQKYEWSGVIVDVKTGIPLDNTNLLNEKGQVLFSTNSKGEFNLVVTFKNQSKRVFECSNVAYESRFIELSPADFKNNLLHQKISLQPKINIFPAIDIQYEAVAPDTVYGLPNYNIGDFCFVNNYTLVLVYTKEKRWKRAEDQNRTYYEGCHLELLDSTNKKIDNYPLDGLYYGIYTQYLDEVFLTSPVSNYRVNIQNGQISLESIDLTSFKAFVEPVVDSIDNTTIASTFNPLIPAFEYYSYDHQDSVYATIHRVEDEEVLSVFRSEYKYLDGRGKLNAIRYEQNTGVDKEIVAAFMSGFANSIFVKPLYAPAFNNHDTLVIFDHYKDKIYHYSASGNMLDSVSIAYHQLKNKIRWKKEIIRDSETGKFFALFEKNGYAYLYEINTTTGGVENQYKLYYKYAERIRIKGNEVFYIYRPFESSQKKFLYQEKFF